LKTLALLPQSRFVIESDRFKFAESHISRKTSEIPDFLYAAPACAACAAFIKESGMKLDGSIKLNRKSGVWGTRD
jgi:hypothetical protein